MNLMIFVIAALIYLAIGGLITYNLPKRDQDVWPMFVIMWLPAAILVGIAELTTDRGEG